MIEALRKFKDAATPEECAVLADTLGTTQEYLFHHLGVHRPLTVERAAQIERATADIRSKNGGRTPVVTRYRVCATCEGCPHRAVQVAS